MSAITGYNNSFPAYKNLSIIDSKLQDLLLNSANVPNIQLIYFCYAWFNLGLAPDPVKWQVYFAAHAYKNSDGFIYLGEKEGGSFFLEGLNYQQLVALYAFLSSYHADEKKRKGEDQAIFHKHLKLIEERFEELCKYSETSCRLLIKSLEDQNYSGAFDFVIRKMEIYVEEVLLPEEVLHPEILINNKLKKAKTNPLVYPHNSLIYFCINQLKNDTDLNMVLLPEPFNYQKKFIPEIPLEVKWQILFASAAFITPNDEVVLGRNFSIDHLNLWHLLILLKIFIAYHDFEKKPEIQQVRRTRPIFDKYIKVVAKEIIKRGAVGQIYQVLEADLEEKRAAIIQANFTRIAEVAQTTEERSLAISQAHKQSNLITDAAREEWRNPGFFQTIVRSVIPTDPRRPSVNLAYEKYTLQNAQARYNLNGQMDLAMGIQKRKEEEINTKHKQTVKTISANLEKSTRASKAVLECLRRELSAS